MDEITFKCLAGCLLKYYRTHAYNSHSKKKLTLKEIVKINTPEIRAVKEIYQRKLNKPFICSAAKLASIEKGEADRSDFVYECISAIFSKYFLYKKRLVGYLQNYVQAVHKSLENPSQVFLEHLLIEIDQAIERYQNYLVYQEIFLLLRACLLYIDHFRLPTEQEAVLFQAMYSAKLETLVPLHNMLGYILTIYAIQTQQLSCSEFLLPSSMCVLVIKSRFAYYFEQRQLDLALDAIEGLRSHPDFQNNRGWQLDYCSCQALALIEGHARSKAAFYLSQCDLLVKHDRSLRMTYYSARLAFVWGMYYLSAHAYLQAYECFWKSLPEYTYWPLPLMAFCLNKLHWPKDAFRELLDHLQRPIPDGIIHAFVKYFQYKYHLTVIDKQDARFLEDILIDNILMQLSKDQFMYVFFYHELIELTQISKRSKLLLVYQML